MVLVRHPGGDWHEPESSQFISEKALQDLVRLSPTLLPGGDELAVVDEFTLPGVGRVDLVGIGGDGRLVVVECKLKANSEIRRAVVGQVLAYAGGLWRLGYEEFAAGFLARSGTALYDAVKAATATELTEAELADAIAANLTSGSFRLVVAVDEITDELRMIIEYLNEHTLDNVQVLALELRYSRDGDVELLTPVVYGEESAVKKTRSTAGVKWTKETFLAEIESRSTPAEASLLKRLIAHGEANGHHLYFGSGKTPGMSCYYTVNGSPTSVWAIYLYENAARVATSFGSIISKGAEDLAVAWRDTLAHDPALGATLDSFAASTLLRFPQFPVSLLAGEPTAATFLASLDLFAQPGTPKGASA